MIYRDSQRLQDNILFTITMVTIVLFYYFEMYMVGDGAFVLHEQLRVGNFHLPNRILQLIYSYPLNLVKILTNDIDILRRTYGFTYMFPIFVSAILVYKRNFLNLRSKSIFYFLILFLLASTRINAGRIQLLFLLWIFSVNTSFIKDTFGKILASITHPYAMICLLFEQVQKRRVVIVNTLLIIFSVIFHFSMTDYNKGSYNASPESVISYVNLIFAIASILLIVFRQTWAYLLIIIPIIIYSIIQAFLSRGPYFSVFQFALKQLSFLFPIATLSYWIQTKNRTILLEQYLFNILFLLMLIQVSVLTYFRVDTLTTIPKLLKSENIRCIDLKEFKKKFPGVYSDSSYNDSVVFTLMLKDKNFDHILNVSDAPCEKQREANTYRFSELLPANDMDRLRPYVNLNIWKD